MKALRGATLLILGMIATIATMSCGQGKASNGTSGPAVEVKPAIVVSILPQAYFVDRVSGGRFNALVLVGPGQSPHSYEPTPRQMAELASSQAWLTIGVDFETSLKPKIAALYPKLAIVDTTIGITYRPQLAHSHEGEAAGEPGADAVESGLDQHVWLGKSSVKTMSANIRDALSKLDPTGAAEYAANYDAFAIDIDTAFEALGPDLEPLKGKPVFVYHPSFGYFLDEFGIEQEAVETGGKEPTQKALTALIAEAKADGARLVFVQPQFSSSAAKTVAEAIGGTVAEIDALAPDWLDNIGRIGVALREAAAQAAAE